METKIKDEFLTLKLGGKDRNVRFGLNVLFFRQGDFHIEYIPSLNLTAYGNTEKEAADMMSDVVVKDYFQNLLELPEHEAMNELRQYGWVRKPFLDRQLRNTKFLDIETIKQDFDLPAETVIRQQYVSV